MIMEKYYEYSDNKKECTYNLVVDSCRTCLFETLCRLEQVKAKQEENNK